MASASSNYLHQYVVIRTDMPRGKMLVHTVHAAGESFYKFPRSSAPRAPADKPEGGGSNPSGGAFCIEETRAVVLGANTEDELTDVAGRLTVARVPHVLIHEIGGAFNGQLVSIGVVPCVRTPELRKLFEHLRCVL
jgi:peptidyl-tRNA hydrolase